MRNTLFVMTHRGASWQSLKSMLEQNPKIHVFTTGIQYNHYDDLEKLWEHNHRNDNAAAWWVDVISDNEKFTCKELAKYCKFLFFLTNPKYCLDRISIQQTFEKKENMFVNKAAYYRFRLRGLAQWWQRTKGPWIDCEREFIDPQSFQNTIETFLPELAFDYQLDEKHKKETPQFEFADGFPPSLKEECFNAYIRYTGIVQGKPLPADGNSHLLSMREA